MTDSVPSTASRHSLSAAATALARFHPEAGGDASRGPKSSDTGELLFRTRISPAIPAAREIAFGPFRLRPAQFLLLEGDKPVHLGGRALEILVVLLERPGELVSKQELMGRVWPDIFVERANLTVHISALRRTLRDGRDGNRFIINVIGRGYSFVAPVEVRHEADTGMERAAGPSSSGWLHGHRVDWEDHVRSTTRKPGEATCEKGARPCTSVDP